MYSFILHPDRSSPSLLPSNPLPQFFLYAAIYPCLSVWTHTPGVHVEVRGQLVGVASLLPLCASLGFDVIIGSKRRDLLRTSLMPGDWDSGLCLMSRVLTAKRSEKMWKKRLCVWGLGLPLLTLQMGDVARELCLL